MKLIDLTNKRFCRLFVLERLPNKGKKVAWKCKCDCGNVVCVESTNLTNAKTKSCGCLKQENLIKRNLKHNQRHTKLYEVWKSIKQRCFNPNNASYKNYGGRGISMSSDWKEDFLCFYNWAIQKGYSENLTIDRINNNGDYCPENCRWVDRIEQANNTRTNRYITFNNVTKTLSQWAKYYNISYSALSSRIYNHWPIEKALLTPIKKHVT